MFYIFIKSNILFVYVSYVMSTSFCVLLSFVNLFLPQLCCFMNAYMLYICKYQLIPALVTFRYMVYNLYFYINYHLCNVKGFECTKNYLYVIIANQLEKFKFLWYVLLLFELFCIY